MRFDEQDRRRKKRGRGPLDPQGLEQLALTYVARYATTSAKLEHYLARKLRERGWMEGGSAPDIAALVQRYCELGYVDDEAYARAQSGSLLRRGYGRNRVNQALHQAGIGEQMREQLAPGEAAQRRAALALARKRRFGPFAPERPELEKREKQIAAMLRAGHSFAVAREILDAPSKEAAEIWAAEVDEEEPGNEY